MTAYKNFTEAMKSRGVELNVHETRNGYARNHDDGTLLAVSVKLSSNKTIAEQYFTDVEYITEHRSKERLASWDTAIEKQSQMTVFVGGEFATTETVMKRKKNPSGPGYFHIPTEVKKVTQGVVEHGNYVLESATPSNINQGYFRLVYKKVGI